jgi:hypothetical protein
MVWHLVWSIEENLRPFLDAVHELLELLLASAFHVPALLKFGQLLNHIVCSFSLGLKPVPLRQRSRPQHSLRLIVVVSLEIDMVGVYYDPRDAVVLGYVVPWLSKHRHPPVLLALQIFKFLLLIRNVDLACLKMNFRRHLILALP